MKKCFKTIFILLILITLPNMVFASNHKLEAVENKAIIREDGTVKVEQVWRYDDRKVKGTEHFINLRTKFTQSEPNNSDETITGYKVFLNDKPLKFEESWNVEASFEEKAGRYIFLALSAVSAEPT